MSVFYFFFIISCLCRCSLVVMYSESDLLTWCACEEVLHFILILPYRVILPWAENLFRPYIQVP